MTTSKSYQPTEEPPAYQPAPHTEFIHQPLLDRTTRIEATQQTTNPTTLSDEELVELTLRWVPPAPPTRPSSRLSRVVAIPQVDRDSYIDGATPFLRAFAPALAAHLITPRDFAAFIDGITIAQAPSPPIQVADMVSDGLGFVPEMWCQMTSLGIGIAAGVVSEATYYARTKMFLKKANAEYFAPRGLKVSVLKDAELQQLVGLSQDTRPLASIDVPRDIISITDRRMAALEGRIASISTQDMPVPVQPTNLIDRLSAKQVEARIRKTRKNQVKKVAKQEKKAAEKEEKLGKKSGGHNSVQQSMSTSPLNGATQGLHLSPWSTQYPSPSPLPPYQDLANTLTAADYVDPPWRPDPPNQSHRVNQPYQSASAPRGARYSHTSPTNKESVLAAQSPASSMHNTSPDASPGPSSRLTPQQSTSEHPPSNHRIQELHLKAQHINLEFDKRKLKKDNQKASKQQRLDEERAEKIGEVEKKIEKEQRKLEKKQEKEHNRNEKHGKGSPGEDQEWDWYGDEERRRSGLGSGVSNKDALKRKEEEMKTLEKERKMAAKLRWIVVENLPDHGAFPEVERVEEQRRFWQI